MYVIFQFLIFSLLSLSVDATEVDNFASRDNPLSDSLLVLDKWTNENFDSAIAEANLYFDRPDLNVRYGNRSARLEALRREKERSSPQSCHEFVLYEKILNRLGSFGISGMETWAKNNPSLDARLVPLNESIYRGTSISRTLLVALMGLAPVIKVNGVQMGIDKLGHFIHNGYEFFEQADLNGLDYPSPLDFVSLIISVQDDEAGTIGALHLGERAESGLWGLSNTRVYSYADISANYAGLVFWRHLLGGENPLVTCENGYFVRKNIFTWADYVDDSWDEAINCSRYFPEDDSIILTNQRQSECPVDQNSCHYLKEKYSPLVAEHILSPFCRK